MKPKRKKAADYPVGYGKPPIETRFVKGRSGNPNGRPKGRKDMKTIIREALFEPLSIQQNGRTIVMPAIAAILLKMRNNALTGDHRAAMAALQLADRAGHADEVSDSDGIASSLDEEAIFDVMREFLDHKAPPKHDTEDGPGGHGDDR